MTEKMWMKLIHSFARNSTCLSDQKVTALNFIRVAFFSNKTTHFGFEDVEEEVKSKKVHDVFSSVAPNYDLMNDVMSFGVHRLWKDKFMSILNPVPGMKLLDVAGGTGDIAFRFIKYLDSTNKIQTENGHFDINEPFLKESPNCSSDEEVVNEEDFHVTVCDINQKMLDIGQNRVETSYYHDKIEWICGNAEKLPVADNLFDAYTIAFGIRNCVHIDKVLSEAYRVLKPGGRFLCLEFSHVQNKPLSMLYDAYSFQVIPVLGQVLARDWHSYQYLVESIRKFPPQDEFNSLIEEAGFKLVTYQNMSFGIVTIHSGYKV
ncbi:2-methoxy-6-polyprenyl-1,4-benzoquinol methylase, mitochondrial [Nymphon striatum]|nr:2-methoxy-6-polyprenyl-1,4-benzoquinol methylase, mitochondrial [Nymphon striatum]